MPQLMTTAHMHVVNILASWRCQHDSLASIRKAIKTSPLQQRYQRHHSVGWFRVRLRARPGPHTNGGGGLSIIRWPAWLHPTTKFIWLCQCDGLWRPELGIHRSCPWREVDNLAEGICLHPVSCCLLTSYRSMWPFTERGRREERLQPGLPEFVWWHLGDRELSSRFCTHPVWGVGPKPLKRLDRRSLVLGTGSPFVPSKSHTSFVGTAIRERLRNSRVPLAPVDGSTPSPPNALC